MEIDLLCNTQWYLGLSSRQREPQCSRERPAAFFLWPPLITWLLTSCFVLYLPSLSGVSSHLHTFTPSTSAVSVTSVSNIPSADPTDSGQKGKDEISQNAFSGRHFLYHSLLLHSFNIHSPWFQDGNFCFLNHARDLQCILGTTWLLLVLGKVVVHCLFWLCERLDIRLVFVYCFEEDVKY